VLASTAILAVFAPVALDGHVLVDGGIANNTPVTTAVRLGASGSSCSRRAFPAMPTSRLEARDRVALHALNHLIARQLVSDVQRLRGEVSRHVIPPLCPLPARRTTSRARTS